MSRIKILCALYSTYTDHKTGVQFTPLLDQQAQTYVGIGEATPLQAETFIGRDGFELLSAAEYLALTTKAERPAIKTTGDPLTDEAAQKGQPLTAETLAGMQWNDVQTLAKAKGVDLKIHRSRADVTAALLALQEAGHPAQTETADEADQNESSESAESVQEVKSLLASAPPPPPGTAQTAQADKADAKNEE